jgi:hypothetical protein
VHIGCVEMAKAMMPKGEVKRKSGGEISILRDTSSSALKVGSIVRADRGSKKRLASELEVDSARINEDNERFHPCKVKDRKEISP